MFIQTSTSSNLHLLADNLFELHEWMNKELERIFREHFVYKKAGITLGGMMPVEAITENLYQDHEVRLKYERLVKLIRS
jgi:hypothetical protein